MKKALIFCISTLVLTFLSPLFGQGFDYSAQANALLGGSGIDAGLCIQVGSGDGKLTAELARSGKYLVHGFDSNPAFVASSRTWIKSQGLYGQASVEEHNFITLPYASNLANVIIIDDFARLSPNVSLSEVFRVLCPKGVAWIGQSGAIAGSVTTDQIKSKLAAAGITDSGTLTQYGTWVKVVKGRSSQMDDWTHLRYGADGNVVSKDLIDIPAGLQWLAGPSWSLGNAKANGLGTVTSGGRVFFFVNGGTTYGSTDPNRRLSIVARDAYNGMLLWERVWTTTSIKFVDDLAPLVPLVATPDVLYTWADNQICALDTKTGNKLRVFATTAVNPPIEMVLDQNRLIFTPSPPSTRGIYVYDALTGTQLWSTSAISMKVIVSGDQVLAISNVKDALWDLVARKVTDGQEQWRVPLSSFSPTVNTGELKLSCKDQALVLSSRYDNHVVKTTDGTKLWYLSGLYPMFAEGLVWLSRAGSWEGFDPMTGVFVKKVATGVFSGCGDGIATDRFFIHSRSYEFVERITGLKTIFKSPVRGPCRTHFVPANNLLYTHPDKCTCGEGRNQIMAYASMTPENHSTVVTASPRLETGVTPAATGITPAASDWPTYRGDALRTGKGNTSVPTNLGLLWEVRMANRVGTPETWMKFQAVRPFLGDWGGDKITDGAITSPVIANGTCYIAVTDEHRVIAMDANSGVTKWSYVAGGRVDSPPTIYKDRCLFGSRDGWVYCLNTANGELIWRFRGAPNDRRIAAYGQMESPWPISGSVLVVNDRLHFSAGRAAGGDGGIRVYALNPMTGAVIWEKIGGFIGGVMNGDSTGVYLGEFGWNATTGANITISTVPGKDPSPWFHVRPYGFLDHGWVRRPDLTLVKMRYAMQDGRGACGQMLVMDSAKTYGYGYPVATPYDTGRHTRNFPNSTGLFCKVPAVSSVTWSVPVPRPSLVQSLIASGDTLFAAGPNDLTQRTDGFLWAVSGSDGSILKQLPISGTPVYDGLAAANGRIYISTEDGRVLCYGLSGPVDTTVPSIPTGLVAAATSVSQINLSWTASTDNIGVTGYKIYRNGTEIASSGGTSYSDTGLTPGTTYAYKVSAYDAAGNTSAQSSQASATTQNDTILPTVAVTSPASGATVAATITLSANASDNMGVVGVQFKVDGLNVGVEDTISPFSVSWNSTSVPNGSHLVTATARDAAGNSQTSSAITITVNNAAPDTIAPTVTLTAPANGATVSGNIAVSASASDNVGVVGVQFKVDGINLGLEDTVAPYSLTMDTTILSNGNHNYSAVARDAAGNATTSAGVTVTVDNAPQPPSTVITSALGGGRKHSIALKDNGTVWTWGANDSKQLGTGSTIASTNIPVQVSALTGMIAVAAGSDHNLALKSDGTVWGWGFNATGQLGDSTALTASTPVKTTGLSSVQEITAGFNHSAAITSDGSVWTWGGNSYGQLGDGALVTKTAPIKITGLLATSIAAGNYYTLAVAQDGSVWGWGCNTSGQLGNGTLVNSSVPVKANGLANITQVSAGTSHTLALKSDGTVWAWGLNNYGQLGTGTTNSSPVAVQVPGLSSIVEVACGGSHSIAIKSDGTIWTWGASNKGQLARAGDSLTPTQVSGETSTVSIAGGVSHTLTLSADGLLKTSGDNGSGKLGIGVTGDKNALTLVSGLDLIAP